MKFLLDSVILIDHLNHISAATKWISKFYSASCLSPITRAEVLVGATSKTEKTVKLLLNGFVNLVFTPKDADLSSALRREHRWKLPDAMQAALAINHGLILVTRNTKDFSPRQYDFVHIPYKI